jgi:hypothetical protein
MPTVNHSASIAVTLLGAITAFLFANRKLPSCIKRLAELFPGCSERTYQRLDAFHCNCRGLHGGLPILYPHDLCGLPYERVDVGHEHSNASWQRGSWWQASSESGRAGIFPIASMGGRKGNVLLCDSHRMQPRCW